MNEKPRLDDNEEEEEEDLLETLNKAIREEALGKRKYPDQLEGRKFFGTSRPLSRRAQGRRAKRG